MNNTFKSTTTPEPTKETLEVAHVLGFYDKETQKWIPYWPRVAPNNRERNDRSYNKVARKFEAASLCLRCAHKCSYVTALKPYCCMCFYALVPIMPAYPDSAAKTHPWASAIMNAYDHSSDYGPRLGLTRAMVWHRADKFSRASAIVDERVEVYPPYEVLMMMLADEKVGSYDYSETKMTKKQ